MQSLFSYAGRNRNGEYNFSRAFRETLIFQTINTFEEDYVPDGAVGVDGYSRKQLTLEQKRRLRNDIMRRAADAVSGIEDPAERARALNSADVIEDAFFETDYGKQFTKQREAFNTNHRDANRHAVASWTTGQSNTDRFRVAISPYDPLFANADGFNNDRIGYIASMMKQSADGKPSHGISRTDVIGENSVISQIPSQNGAGKRLVITGVHPGGSRVAEYDDAAANAMRSAGDIVHLYGESELSGYNLLDRYIKTKESKRDVRQVLVSSMQGGRQLSQEEREFIEGACRYFSENGIDFDITAKAQDGTITANIGSRCQVRLWDRDEPKYQGRIYDNGLVGYASYQTNSSPTSETYKAHSAAMDGAITAEDRLAAIDYYFGGRPLIADDGLPKARRIPIGADTRISPDSGDRTTQFYGYQNNTYFSTYKTATDAVTNINIGIHPVDIPGSGKNTAVINFRIDPSKSPYTAILPDLSDSVFINGQDTRGNRLSDTLNDNLLEEDMYPSDCYYDAESDDHFMNDKVPLAHAEWYRHAVARNVLDDWVTSAKEHHAELVNIDDIVDKFQQYGADGYEYPYDGDERIAEIQKLYWDVLSGTKSTGKAKKSRAVSIDGTDEEDIDAPIELDAFDSKVFSLSIEEKRAEIEKHYQRYVDTAFGSVPRLIPRPDMGVSPERVGEIRAENEKAGFNPTMVARYTTMGEAHSVQRNYDYIRHMLSQLGDDYTDGFVKDNTYIGNEIRKDLIKYDPNTAVFKRYSAENGRNLGIPFGQICRDGDLSHVDYDALYKMAPNLKDMPVTTDMLLHTADTLMRSGCALNSIEVNVDANGIISYRAAQRQFNSKSATYSSYDVNGTYARRGEKVDKNSGIDPNYTIVDGQIGQVFEPDQNGVIVPKYASSKPSKVIVPGYDAYLVDNDGDEPKPMRDRLRLSDWQHQMKRAISSEIHKATLGNPAQYDFVPHTTSLNSVYRHTYDMEMTEQEYREKLNPDIYSQEEVDTFKRVITTLTKRCRFPNEYGEGSTTTAQSYLEHPTEDEARRFDYYYSDLCDNTNLRTLGPQFDGIFDPNMTGTAKNQGLVRYLADGVTVDSSTGKVAAVPVDNPEDPPRCALMKDDLFKLAEHDSWDRRQMPTTMVLTALGTPRNVGAAMMTLEGDTFDDGFTVSSDFAGKNRVRGENGEFRDLIPQDKLSDLHGNKGVISRVVRRDQWSGEMVNHVNVEDIADDNNCIATYEGQQYTFRMDPSAIIEDDPTNPREDQIRMQATKAIQKQLGIDDKKCKIFHDNPDLDIVMSPYSGMSRSNGGTVRELMSSPDDLTIDGKTIEGGMGHMNFIVVNMLADKKTHWYDEDAVSEGKGRKASGQLLWQLEAKGATAIINEFYGTNTPAWDSLREYAIVTGFDIDEDLRPVVGYHEQTSRGEHRRVFELPPADEIASSISVNKNMAKNVLNMSKLTTFISESTIQADMNKMGGFMELPFQLDFKTFDRTQGTPPDVKKKMASAFMTPRTGNTYAIGDQTYDTYGVPVLPPSLRSGQDFKDGTARNHDYTTWYLDIYKQAISYVAIQAEMQKPDIDQARRNALAEALDQTKEKAQASFDKIVSDVVDKQFNTKHNVIRDNVFTAKIPSSATAVVSADAALKSDEIAMSREHAVQLGIMDYDEEKQEYYWSNRRVGEDGKTQYPGDGKCLIWRDPLLREGGVRYMSVVIDDSVTGIKMNPAMGKSFDGDFDGDSYGVIGLRTRAAQKEAFEKFHVSNNMLDLGAGKDKNGMYPLFVSSGMDITARMFEDSKLGDKGEHLQERFDDITRRANAAQAAIESGNVDAFEYDALVQKVRTVKRVVNGTEVTREVRVRDREGNPVYETNPDGSYKRQTVKGQEALAACKREAKDDLDAFLHDAFTGVAVDHIVVKNPQTVVASVQHIVDSGAKGNAGKMRDFMDNVGIDYEIGVDGRADASTAHNITLDSNGEVVARIVKRSIEEEPGAARRHDNAIQETAAYKADNTALGGTSSQNGVCAFRNFNLHETLEMTYPTTQSILQSKHDPKDAKIKDEIVRFWGKDVWDGYKLTGNWNETDEKVIQETAHERIKVPVLDDAGNRIPVRDFKGNDEHGNPIYVDRVDEKGNPVYETTYARCSKDEWCDQMRGMMKALKVTVNEDYIKTLADAMYDPEPRPVISAETGKKVYNGKTPVMCPGGQVMGVTEFAEKHGALLDKIAYTGRLTALKNAALSHNQDYVNIMAEKNIVVQPAGSLVGNALEVGAEAYAHDFAAKQATTPEEMAEERAKAKAARAKVEASGMPVPTALIAEKFGDIHRAETGDSQNPVHKRSKDKTTTVIYVDPVPLGRKDCRVSKHDFEDASFRVMGETAAEFEVRSEAVKRRKAATSAAASEQPAAAAVESVATPDTAKPGVVKIGTVDYSQGAEGSSNAKPTNSTKPGGSAPPSGGAAQQSAAIAFDDADEEFDIDDDEGFDQ